MYMVLDYPHPDHEYEKFGVTKELVSWHKERDDAVHEAERAAARNETPQAVFELTYVIVNEGDTLGYYDAIEEEDLFPDSLTPEEDDNGVTPGVHFPGTLNR